MRHLASALALGFCASTAFLLARPVAAPECVQPGSRDETEWRAQRDELLRERARLTNEIRALRAALHEAEPATDGDTQREPRRASVLTWLQPQPAPSFEQQKLRARQFYGELFRELALSERQVEAALAVLVSAAQRIRAPVPPETLELSSDELRELEDALGADNLQPFEQLRKTLPARAEVRRVRDQLEQAGEPMDQDQQRALVAVLSSKPHVASPLRANDEPAAVSFERFRSWVADRDRRLREGAAEILSSRQIKQLEDDAALRHALRPTSAAGAAAGSGG